MKACRSCAVTTRFSGRTMPAPARLTLAWLDQEGSVQRAPVLAFGVFEYLLVDARTSFAIERCDGCREVGWAPEYSLVPMIPGPDGSLVHLEEDPYAIVLSLGLLWAGQVAVVTDHHMEELRAKAKEHEARRSGDSPVPGVTDGIGSNVS